MTDDKQQPYRPPDRSPNRYRQIAKETTELKTQATTQPAETNSKNLFSLTITVSNKGSEPMGEKSLNENTSDEQQFLIDLVFKPNKTGLKLRPAETQLLLAYIGEILKEIEDGEKMIEEEQKVTQGQENVPCK